VTKAQRRKRHRDRIVLTCRQPDGISNVKPKAFHPVLQAHKNGVQYQTDRFQPANRINCNVRWWATSGSRRKERESERMDTLVK
jgi:hypothetical protein